MTRSTSEVAACCSSASASSRLHASSCCTGSARRIARPPDARTRRPSFRSSEPGDGALRVSGLCETRSPRGTVDRLRLCPQPRSLDPRLTRLGSTVCEAIYVGATRDCRLPEPWAPFVAAFRHSRVRFRRPWVGGPLLGTLLCDLVRGSLKASTSISATKRRRPATVATLHRRECGPQ